MAQKTLNTRIILRNDTSENFQSINPILLKGEIGLEIDTLRYKIGDGSTKWNDITSFKHISNDEYLKLQKIIELVDKDELGKVNDVTVNGESVLGEDKVAKIIIGDVTYSEETQEVSHETFTQSIILHKISKTGKYSDLLEKPNVIDNLDSTSITDILSANQGNVLKKMIQNIAQAKSFSTISDMVSALNGYSNTELKIAMNLYIQALNVPDFWVYSVEETNVTYSYVSDDELINKINQDGFIQIGYYKISKLETDKVDLTNYYNKSQIDGFISTINGSISTLSDKITAIENDETILRTTDILILNGGNSNIGG